MRDSWKTGRYHTLSGTEMAPATPDEAAVATPYFMLFGTATVTSATIMKIAIR